MVQLQLTGDRNILDMSIFRRLLIAGIFVHAACASPPPRMAMRAPNPNGCYLMLFAAPRFEGASDVINGPARLSALDRLRDTNYSQWANRIRSLRVGAIATVTLFSESRFRGLTNRLQAGSEHPEITASVSQDIESLEIRCQQ